jgi:hypothetical protein
MTRRIELWSFAGFIVACGWCVFMMAIGPANGMRLESGRLFWVVAEITAPASLLRHFASKYYWFILLNALIYGLIGLGIEMWRRTSARHVSVPVR